MSRITERRADAFKWFADTSDRKLPSAGQGRLRDPAPRMPKMKTAINKFLPEWQNSAALFRCRAESGERFGLALRSAVECLSSCVIVDANVRSGVPTIAGTRVPVSLVLAELSEGSSLDEVAADYELNPDTLRDLFRGMANLLDEKIGL